MAGAHQPGGRGKPSLRPVDFQHPHNLIDRILLRGGAVVPPAATFVGLFHGPWHACGASSAPAARLCPRAPGSRSCGAERPLVAGRFPCSGRLPMTPSLPRPCSSLPRRVLPTRSRHLHVRPLMGLLASGMSATCFWLQQRCGVRVASPVPADGVCGSSYRPVFELQSRNPSKILRIAGEHDQPTGQCNGRDTQIHRAHA